MTKKFCRRARLAASGAALIAFLGLVIVHAEEPLLIRSGEAQLFIDDHLIESQAGLVRTLHQPKKEGGGNQPVLALEREFGDVPGTLEANGTILHDPRLKRWVMFALAFSSSWPGESEGRVRLYRFTSPDAKAWIKGDAGEPQRIVFDLEDAASKTRATNIDLFSCFFDEKDAAFPYKGWLHFANWGIGREGTYYVRSADGKTWERVQQVMASISRTIQQGDRTLYGPGDVTTFYPDAASGRFLANLRFASPTAVGPDNRLRARAFLFVDRVDQTVDLGALDRVDLVPAAAAADGDLPHDEYYSSTAWRYGSMWLGGLRIWHGGGDYPCSAAGCAFLKLVSSRDGLRWKKVRYGGADSASEVFLPNGEEGGNGGRNDGGYMTEFSNAPLLLQDELVYYYASSSWGKSHPRDRRVSGGGIFRATLRPDGFVSVDGGTLTTRPLRFEGRELAVNAIGPVEVEALDLEGRPLAKAAIRGDALRHPAAFDGRSLLSAAPGGAAKLRFTVPPGGRLFSFTIDPPPPPARKNP